MEAARRGLLSPDFTAYPCRAEFCRLKSDQLLLMFLFLIEAFAFTSSLLSILMAKETAVYLHALNLWY